MYCRNAYITLLALSGAISCNRQPRPQAERIAILRFENLGSDVSTDWMGRALSEIVTTEVTGSPGADVASANRIHSFNQTLGIRPISAPGISAERTLAMAAGANRIGYGTYAVRDGRLQAQLSIEDVHTGKMTQTVMSSAPADDVIGVASGLSRAIAKDTAAYGTRDLRALHSWVNALESGDAARTGQSLEEAIAADPDFGPPYRLLAQWKAQSQDRAGSVTLLEQALSRGDRIPAGERARMAIELANLREDVAGRQRALAELLKLEPRDAPSWRLLGETAVNRRDYAVAIQAFQKSLEIEPEDANTWNQLGYAAARTGDLTAAMSALHRYEQLRPAEANPLDSQGDVNLMAGRLREAEGFYLQAARKNAAFPNSPDTFKAAMARLMTGDIAGADGIAKQYTDARRAANDPVVEYFEAEWSWVTGRRKQGYEKLAAFAQSAAANARLKDTAARAYAELAIWSLILKDRAAADQNVQKSVPLAGPSSAALVILARFLAQPAVSASDWTARADQLFPNASQGAFKETALAYALLLAKEYQPASLILKQMYDRVGPNSEENIPVLLAWTWLETGHAKEAAALLRPNPIPPLSGPGPLVSLYFPRIYQLRALVAEQDGKQDEARTNQRLFQTLSGPEPAQN